MVHFPCPSMTFEKRTGSVVGFVCFRYAYVIFFTLYVVVSFEIREYQISFVGRPTQKAPGSAKNGAQTKGKIAV